MNVDLWMRHAWPSMLQTVRAHRPLTRAEAIADYAWLERTSGVPGRPTLMQRWGWSEYETRQLLDEVANRARRTLSDPCPIPGRDGVHETYTHGGGYVCRACGASGGAQ